MFGHIFSPSSPSSIFNWMPGDEDDAGSPGGDAGATGVDDSKKDKGASPQTVEVEFADGTKKPIPVDELTKVFKNSDAIVKEKVDALRQELEENVDLKAEKKAQERLNNYLTQVKQANPELYEQLFGKADKPKDAKPTSKLDTTPLTSTELDLPELNEIDFEDAEATKRAVAGLYKAIGTISDDKTALLDQLNKIAPIVDKLATFDPEALKGTVSAEAIAALREEMPKVATQVKDAITLREEKRKEINQATTQVHAVVEEKLPLLEPELSQRIQRKILGLALMKYKFAQDQRITAIRTKDPNPPPVVPLSRIITDVAKDELETITYAGADLARAHAKGFSTLPTFVPSGGTAEPEKKTYSSPEEARLAFLQGER